jgi:hypothetical protein
MAEENNQNQETEEIEPQESNAEETRNRCAEASVFSRAATPFRRRNHGDSSDSARFARHGFVSLRRFRQLRQTAVRR